MAVAKVSSSGLWIESPAADAELPVPAFLQDNGSGQFVMATSGVKDAAAFDWHFNGTAAAEYEVVDLRAPWVLVDDGSGRPTPASSGTVFAILIADGDTGLQVSTNLALEEAGSLYVGADGAVIAVRFDAPEMHFLKIGTTYRSYT